MDDVRRVFTNLEMRTRPAMAYAAVQGTRCGVLGIDPGTATTGYAVVEEEGGAASLIAIGVISTRQRRRFSLCACNRSTVRFAAR